MKKSAAALFVLITAVACASTSSPSAPSYIMLSEPNQIRDYDVLIRPTGLRISGTLTPAGFHPAGEVEGNGQFCADGKDWLSLSEMKVHRASEGKTPTAPYLAGCVANNGVFHPASRHIVTTDAEASASR